MVDVVSDIVMPKELIIPEATGTSSRSVDMSGANIFISGGALTYGTADKYFLVTAT